MGIEEKADSILEIEREKTQQAKARGRMWARIAVVVGVVAAFCFAMVALKDVPSSLGTAILWIAIFGCFAFAATTPRFFD